ncbi:DNA mismatch repair protein MLH3 [Pichia kudriavzevii]|uniref:DNA mismatch repair protein MLH3 n=1 Tax=Pichia kudriavzevii TaxID=4909 RepID=A0A1V2LPM8_PICKU|nr:DNA mismatch repair protein MLH3 [Pichia kudriavzevii]
MSRIQKLCSGICTTLQSQVKLNSLSDVVRELVQNGVDADSSSISIKVYVNYFENSIELSYSDDGIGMDPETLEVFGKRNYTSKLTTELNSENLDLSVLSDVHTFGFRGEAMNSLRKLCDTVIVISRTVGYNNAFKAIFKSDEMIGDVVRHPFVFPRGTSIKVLGLFDSVLQMKLLNLTFGGSISENYEICKVEYQGYKLKIGIGTTVSQSKKFQFAYINGRPLVNQEFFKFVNILFQKGYEKWGTTVKYDANKPSSMYGRPYSVNPIFVAYFNLPFEVDDIIQDPKKYCYNTKYLPILQRMLSKSVDIYFEIFCNHKIRENGEYHSEYIPVKKQKIQHHYISDMKADIRKLNLKDSEAERRLSNEDIHTMGKNVVFESGEIQEGLTSISMSPKTRGTILAIDETKPAEACECENTRNIEINSQVPYSQKDLKNTSKFFSRQDNLMITRESIKQFKIVGQVESKFILVKFRNMLIGMDQHASDERINLEKTYQSLIQKSIDQVYHQVNEVRRVSFHPSDLELIRDTRTP